jgi:hypothetical protein
MSYCGWVDWYHETSQPLQPTTTYVLCTSISTTIWRVILLPSAPLPTTISCCSPPQPMSGPSPVPMMHSTSQPSSGSPSTSTYNLGISESASPSYAPYGSLPQNNPYFPFPCPPQSVSPPHGQPHAYVNFVQPSPIQQLHTFEHLNTENPTHQPDNSKKKGKN